MSKKQFLIIGFGNILLDLDSYLDEATIFFHVASDKIAFVYSLSGGIATKTLCTNKAFKEVPYTDRRICKFETSVKCIDETEIFAEYNVRRMATDPPTRPVERIADYLV